MNRNTDIRTIDFETEEKLEGTLTGQVYFPGQHIFPVYLNRSTLDRIPLSEIHGPKIIIKLNPLFAIFLREYYGENSHHNDFRFLGYIDDQTAKVFLPKTSSYYWSERREIHDAEKAIDDIPF